MTDRTPSALDAVKLATKAAHLSELAGLLRSSYGIATEVDHDSGVVYLRLVDSPNPDTRLRAAATQFWWWDGNTPRVAMGDLTDVAATAKAVATRLEVTQQAQHLMDRYPLWQVTVSATTGKLWATRSTRLTAWQEAMGCDQTVGADTVEQLEKLIVEQNRRTVRSWGFSPS